MGTSVGTEVFLKDGRRPAAALSVAWSGFTLVVLLIRGPHCKRYTWFGYEGGTNLRRYKTSDSEETKTNVDARMEVAQRDSTGSKECTDVVSVERKVSVV